jgi:hypothetical protein
MNLDRLQCLCDRFVKLAGIWDEMGDWAEEDRRKEEQRKADQRAKNEKVWPVVEAWFAQFGQSQDDDYDRKEVLEFDPEYAANPVVRLGMIYPWPHDSKMVVDAKVNRETGEAVIDNVRVIFKGQHIPPELLERIRLATGKTIKYHRPTNAWVYDAQLDGKLKPGDPRMIEVAQALNS